MMQNLQRVRRGPRFVRHPCRCNRAPLIGDAPQRAGASQGRVAVSTPVGRGSRQLVHANRHTRGERHDQGRARGSMTLPTLRASRAPALGHETARTALPGGTGSASRVRTRPPPSPTATRRSSTNAPQRAGAPQRKVAIERAGAKSRHDFVPGSRTGSNGGNVDSLTATRPTETHVPTLATSVRFYRRR